MNPFEDDRKLELTLGDARKINAVLRAASYVPSIFGEVAEVINLLEAKFGEINEVANRADDNGEEG